MKQNEVGESTIPCAASIVNKNFEHLLREVTLIEDQPKSVESWQRRLRDEWKHKIKRDFGFAPLQDNRTYIVQLPRPAKQDVVLSCGQIKDAFDKVTVDILRLVVLIVMVGGFGRCCYVGDVIQQ